MMFKAYVSNPVTIHAEEWQPGKDFSSFGVDIRESAFIDGAFILTPEGQHIIRPGYFVVKGTKGEFYGVHPDVFKEKYRLVEPTGKGES